MMERLQSEVEQPVAQDKTSLVQPMTQNGIAVAAAAAPPPPP
ncbi:Os01g0929800 [Oryza sativa Japonica Group]|uniref:Os01g0929800 protein n=1 Tax=Oryza sativa subsp. japonica TaxID=39947 RepID=C7IX06_ORYSJ|nr:Os01g0929800 [Oryza sativa Japonica Group]|eukprot:NP_001172720.1 Os01g0929800 [Oryza sativa Japonica Group]